MKDFRQLVRWALPGFICLTLFVLLILVADPTRTKPMLEYVRGSDTQDGVNVLGGIVGAIALVTAIGFIISTGHHLLLNSIYPAWLSADLRDAIRVVGLDVRGYDGYQVAVDNLSISGAWIVANVAWHASKGTSDSRVAAAEWRSQSMYDIMHGAGATFIGVIVAVISAVLSGSFSGWMLVTSGVALLVVTFNLRGTAKRAEAVTGGLMAAVLPSAGTKTIWVNRRSVCRRLYRKTPAGRNG